MRRRRFLIHSFAHGVNDLYSGFLAPLLPTLASKHHLSLPGAGLIATLLTLSASLSQPIWGFLSDRRPSRWFIPGGILASGIFLSLLGVVPNRFLLVIVVLAGGLGVASFHPQGAALASALVGRRKGLAIALFITAGSVGYALGPLFISNLVEEYGLNNTYLAVFPALIMAAVWLLFGPKIYPKSAAPNHHLLDPPQPAIPWKAIAWLSATSTVRAFVMLSYLNFLSFHLQTLDLSLSTRSLYLFTLQIGDAAGNLVGGTVSDRLGRWRIMLWSPMLAVPLLTLFLLLQGGWSLLPLFFAGVALFASAPAVVVGSQKMMLRRESMGSALQVGFAWGLAGLLMSLVGKAGELFTVHTVLFAVSFCPLLMTLFAWKFRKYRPQFEV